MTKGSKRPSNFFRISKIIKYSNTSSKFCKDLLLIQFAGEITGIQYARMEWKNYERKIICGYGYKLSGWPTHVPITNGIDNLSESVLRDIVSQLHAKTIYWKAVTETEVAKLKKSLSALPQRPDRGVKRKRYSRAQAAEGKLQSPTLRIVDVSLC